MVIYNLDDDFFEYPHDLEHLHINIYHKTASSVSS